MSTTLTTVTILELTHAIDYLNYNTRMVMCEKDLEIMKLIGMIKDMTTDVPVNFGKGLDEVQERQRRWNMIALKEGCKRALWFSDSFQIDLLKLVFCGQAYQNKL